MRSQSYNPTRGVLGGGELRSWNHPGGSLVGRGGLCRGVERVSGPLGPVIAKRGGSGNTSTLSPGRSLGRMQPGPTGAQIPPQLGAQAQALGRAPEGPVTVTLRVEEPTVQAGGRGRGCELRGEVRGPDLGAPCGGVLATGVCGTPRNWLKLADGDWGWARTPGDPTPSP